MKKDIHLNLKKTFIFHQQKMGTTIVCFNCGNKTEVDPKELNVREIQFVTVEKKLAPSTYLASISQPNSNVISTHDKYIMRVTGASLEHKLKHHFSKGSFTDHVELCKHCVAEYANDAESLSSSIGTTITFSYSEYDSPWDMLPKHKRTVLEVTAGKKNSGRIPAMAFD